MDVVSQVRNRGAITLSAGLREKYGIESHSDFLDPAKSSFR